jgi:hypothetical protein
MKKQTQLKNRSTFLFSHQEVLFARAGLYIRMNQVTPSDVITSMREIEEYQKRTYGYDCVKVVRNRNDPMMVDVYVKRKLPTTICDYRSDPKYHDMNRYIKFK